MNSYKSKVSYEHDGDDHDDYDDDIGVNGDASIGYVFVCMYVTIVLRMYVYVCIYGLYVLCIHMKP